ncbi:hypothetical protein K449DRAFT_431706 [Hypoxylon sp. EC38]|nr:hypothetical protein K449DRAFT_431706 [Hypoxylon sp. EC38]
MGTLNQPPSFFIGEDFANTRDFTATLPIADATIIAHRAVTYGISVAIKAYEQAASLALSDPSALSNLSAANLEAGKYSERVDSTAKSLNLLEDDLGAAAARRNLLARQTNVYLHLSRLEEAEKLLGQLSTRKETEYIYGLVEESKEFAAQDVPEYYGLGHDQAKSLYTLELEESTGNDPVLSIMLCGCGDARHFSQTLIYYAFRKKGAQKLCMTMFDHKSAKKQLLTKSRKNNPPEPKLPLLLDDERGDKTTSARNIRAGGVNILSTASEPYTATFWLRSDVVDLMVRKEWNAYI